MRVAYALRRIGSALTDEASTYVIRMASLLAGAGARVTVVTETPESELASLRSSGVAIERPDPVPEDRWYLSGAHRYADRVAATVARLAETGLDIAELPAAGGEAFTAVRCRRLMGTPQRTTVVTRLHRSVGEDHTIPVSFHDDIRAFAERYAVRHADAATASASSLLPPDLDVVAAWPAPSATPAEPRPEPIRISGPIRRVLYIGELSPRAGLDRFLAAARLIARRDRSFSFEVCGHDTPTDPLGRSYRAWIADRHLPPMDGHVRFRDPSALESGAMPDTPALCVIADPWPAPSAALHAAMASGAVVIAADVSGTGLDDRCAVLADVTDPEALAAAVVESADRPSVLRALAARARDLAERRCDPEAVRRASEGLYQRALAASPPRHPVSRARSSPEQGKSSTARLSVVVPLFNQGDYVQAAVKSALASDHPDLEVIVVDDGSTDPATRQVFNDLHGVIKIRQENRGLPAARNAGIAASSGELILPLDADDLIHPAYAGLAARALERAPELAYVTSYARNFGLFDTGFAPVGNLLTLMPFLHTDGRSASVYRRSALDQVGGYDEGLPAYEDWDLQIRLGKAGLDGDVLPAELFFYRRHGASLVFRYSNAHRVELLQWLMRRHADLLVPQGLDLALKLAHLWRTGFESSESTRFLAARDMSRRPAEEAE